MDKKGFLVLESGLVFRGKWHGGDERAGEVVFNTSHAGFEEMATDPSYYNQILVLTAPMQGNYGSSLKAWESRQIWIEGFCCVEMQDSTAEASWKKKLLECGVPILSGFDTRTLVLNLRDQGTAWGALVVAQTESEALDRAGDFIKAKKKADLDWVFAVSVKQAQDYPGRKSGGPRIALIDYGYKANILRELQQRCSEVRIFPSRTLAREIEQYEPDGVVLSNGPGDPRDVKQSTETVRDLLGKKPIFGICMGHQVLAQALGAPSYKMRFGHRGGNHPVKDHLLDQIYVTSQNHGYAVDADRLSSDVRITHINLNDKTVEGIVCEPKKCMSVQYHPESCPGPHEASRLFDYFLTMQR